jgi:hypothetical protein
MRNAFSRDIRPIRAQENIAVHLGSLVRRTSEITNGLKSGRALS